MKYEPNLRPDWKEPVNCKKFNLSNNICIDSEINLSIDISSMNQYADAFTAYHAVGSYYKVKIEHMAIGFGIGELFPRMLLHGNLGSITIVEPTWPMPKVYLTLNNIPYHSISYRDFTNISHDELKQGKTDTLYIANPNGINGTVLTKENLIQILPYYKFVICDEAYMDFSNHSMIEFYEKYPNLIILKTFSKSIAMPGLRFGFCISSNKELINHLQMNRPSSVMTGVTASLVPKLVEMIPEHVARMKITKNKIESIYDCVSSEGNYVLLKKNSMINYDTAQIKEVNQGIYRMALFNMNLYNEIIK
jgi:histidinol-phosphate/aromatic aminotransferase/cobyric acid decarboxylase-like protein